MANHRLWPARVGWPARRQHDYRDWSFHSIWDSRNLVLRARFCTIAVDMGDSERVSVSKSVAHAPCDTALRRAGCNQIHAHLLAQSPQWPAEHTVLVRSTLGRRHSNLSRSGGPQYLDGPHRSRRHDVFETVGQFRSLHMRQPNRSSSRTAHGIEGQLAENATERTLWNHRHCRSRY